jgi:tetratricopeptide (TPR) repeat protein
MTIINSLSIKLRNVPGLFRFLAADTVADLVEKQHVEKLRKGAAVEAAQRLWLYCGYGDNESYVDDKHFCERALSSYLGEQALERIQHWALSQADRRSFTFESPSVPESFSNALNTLLTQWEHAEGVGIFVATENQTDIPLADSVLLPFDVVYGEGRGAFSRERRPLPHLKKSVDAACIAAKKADYLRDHQTIALHFTTLIGDCSAYLGDESLGLAVLTVLRLIKNDVKPGMNYLASGVLEGSALLRGERNQYQKKLSAFYQTSPKLIVLPECDIEHPDKEKVVFLPLNFKAPFENATSIAVEEKIVDIKQMVESIGSKIQYSAISYEDAEKQLRQLLKKIQSQHLSQKHQQAQALAWLHLGAVCCHLGRPQEAERYLERVCESSLEPLHIALALVRNAVVQTDLFNWNEVFHSLDLASEKIKGIGYAMDITMRFHGTRGQALMYTALSINDPEERLNIFEEALSDFQIALDNAEDEADRAQDISYIYLAHALHAPDRITPKMVEDTRKACAGTPSDPYVLRASWLASYRALLLGISDVPLYTENLPLDKFKWLRALSLKYRGALYASNGNFEQALTDFKEACSLLSQQPDMMGMLRISIVLQAAESLLPERPDEATAYLREIEKTFETPGYDNLLAGPVQGNCWLQRAQEILSTGAVPVDSTNHPQLHFPY